MRILGAVAIALLLLPATVAAGSQPSVYYLRDSELGVAADGELNATVPNATQPSVRLVPVGASMVAPVRFQSSETDHPPRLLGPVYVAIWMGPSPVAAANLTVSLVALGGSETRSLLNASFPLDANASQLPQPTALVPPTPAVPPTDPQGYATYLASFILMQVLPTVTPPPRFLMLGSLDLEILPAEQLALEFSITQGGSPLPMPAGAFGSIQYNGASTPSLVYVPWYSPNPQVVSTWQPIPPPRSSSPSSNVGPSPSGESDAAEADSGSGVPGPEFVLLLAVVLGTVALVRRRK